MTMSPTGLAGVVRLVTTWERSDGDGESPPLLQAVSTPAHSANNAVSSSVLNFSGIVRYGLMRTYTPIPRGCHEMTRAWTVLQPPAHTNELTCRLVAGVRPGIQSYRLLASNARLSATLLKHEIRWHVDE